MTHPSDLEARMAAVEARLEQEMRTGFAEMRAGLQQIVGLLSRNIDEDEQQSGSDES